MKAIIIDDEKRARQLLATILAENCPEVTLCGDAEDLPNGVKLIHKTKPDIIFLDIEMPGHSGLEILDFFDADDIQFNIIFTTAYNDFAVQAFKLNAIDYLLKPLQITELVNAVNKVKNQTPQQQVLHYQQLANTLQPDASSRLAIPDSNGFTLIGAEDLVYIEAEGAYTELFLTTGKKMTTSRKLKYFEEKLATKTNFFRIHRSYLVNINHIKKFSRGEGGTVELSNGTTLPVSREKSAFLLEKLEGM